MCSSKSSLPLYYPRAHYQFSVPINPFIYAAKYRDFQQGVRRLISKVKRGKQQSQVSAIA